MRSFESCSCSAIKEDTRETWSLRPSCKQESHTGVKAVNPHQAIAFKMRPLDTPVLLWLKRTVSGILFKSRSVLGSFGT